MYYMRADGDVSRDRYPEATHGEMNRCRQVALRKRQILNGHNFDACKVWVSRNVGVLCTEARARQELCAVLKQRNEG
jgi:hypothetical protein